MRAVPEPPETADAQGPLASCGPTRTHVVDAREANVRERRPATAALRARQQPPELARKMRAVPKPQNAGGPKAARCGRSQSRRRPRMRRDRSHPAGQPGPTLSTRAKRTCASDVPRPLRCAPVNSRLSWPARCGRSRCGRSQSRRRPRMLRDRSHPAGRPGPTLSTRAKRTCASDAPRPLRCAPVNDRLSWPARCGRSRSRRRPRMRRDRSHPAGQPGPTLSTRAKRTCASDVPRPLRCAPVNDRLSWPARCGRSRCGRSQSRRRPRMRRDRSHPAGQPGPTLSTRAKRTCASDVPRPLRCAPVNSRLSWPAGCGRSRSRKMRAVPEPPETADAQGPLASCGPTRIDVVDAREANVRERRPATAALRARQQPPELARRMRAVPKPQDAGGPGAAGDRGCAGTARILRANPDRRCRRARSERARATPRDRCAARPSMTA
jgi:hypothetical protein